MRDQRRVVAVAYGGLSLFEFGIVVEMFALPRPELRVPWYRFTVCSVETGPLKALGGVTVRAPSGLRALNSAGTIVIPGWRDPDEPPPRSCSEAYSAPIVRGASRLDLFRSVRAGCRRASRR